jgi:uncharacterized protein YfaQ (DUF2300 family)
MLAKPLRYDQSMKQRYVYWQDDDMWLGYLENMTFRLSVAVPGLTTSAAASCVLAGPLSLPGRSAVDLNG